MLEDLKRFFPTSEVIIFSGGALAISKVNHSFAVP
jgi:hypothetical protein